MSSDFIRYQGLRFRKTDEVKPPKKRFTVVERKIIPFPCYTKEICQVPHCSKADRIHRDYGKLRAKPMIIRQPCDKDCVRRIVFEKVPITVCIKAKCKYLNIQSGYCEKYVEEAKSPRSKPPPFQFAKGLRTPSGGDRGWYGQKDPRTGQFV